MGVALSRPRVTSAQSLDPLWRPSTARQEPTQDDGMTRQSATDAVKVAAVAAPWGPVHVAATESAVVAIAVLAPRDGFIADALRRTGRDLAGNEPNAVLDRAVAALEAFLDGSPALLEALPLDLADRGSWDRAVLGGVRTLGWGEVTSYGRLAGSIGRRGAARAVGGSV